MPTPGSDERPSRPTPGAAGRPAGGAQRTTSSGRTVAGRYRLDRVLGKGSMGTVWAAYDETLHRRVAIKEIYFPEGTPPAEAAMLVERTLREARAIAQLSHPNVITLYDILTLQTGPVIVMEVLAARSLGEVLKEVGPLTVGQAATVGLAVAAGLAAAHAAGITHRDVKPGNVLIGGDGRIKLTDFGIARSSSENPMTATGLLLGSPAYIAPEVATGATAGPPADAWGLGALLFACVEGKPPFDKGSPVATLMSVVNDPVPTLQNAGAVAPVIKGLLVKDPAHRLNLRQARGALRPLADDPVETRLVFNAPVGDAGRPSARPPATPIRPDSGLVGPRQGTPGPAGYPQQAGPRGPAKSSAQPPATQPFRPAWVDEAPPRTGVNPPRPPARAAGIAGQSGSAGITGQTGVAGSAGQRSPGGTAALPPPPWADSGSGQLAPLPAGRSTPVGSVGAVVTPSNAARRWIALIVFLAAAVLAYFGIRAIAETVTHEQTLASVVAIGPPVGSLE